MSLVLDDKIIEIKKNSDVIVEFARYMLHKAFDIDSRFENSKGKIESIVFPELSDLKLNVTLRCGGKIRGSMSSSGNGLDEKINLALKKSLADRRFNGPITRCEVERTSIEVWIQYGSEPIAVEERVLLDCIQLGDEGVEISYQGKFAYYKPSVAITRPFKNAQDMFAALCKKAKLEENSWQDDGAELRKTQWICLMYDSAEDKCGIVSKLRFEKNKNDMHNQFPFRQWLSESCLYFSNQQQSNGEISYLYDPIDDTVSNDQINIVRAGGCLWSLSQALNSGYLATPFPLYLTAKNLAKFLSNKLVSWEGGGKILSDKASLNAPKLGATALFAAGLFSKDLAIDFADEHRALQFSLHTAQFSNGKFLTNFGLPEENSKLIDFYSGQAILALILMAEEGDNEALEKCNKAFLPYCEHFKNVPKTAFVGWHADAWARMYNLTGERKFAEFTLLQLDWLLNKQILEGRDNLYIGGFASNAKSPNYSSIVFVEAVLVGLELAIKINDQFHIEKYSKAGVLGLKFCESLRLANVPSAFFPEPSKSKGGIGMGLLKNTVRCDVVQHFITLCIAAIKVEEFL